MPATCDGLAADEMALAGQRLAEWLAPFSAKALMVRFRVSLDTAKGWKAGQMPANRHLLRMVRDWGDEFLGHLFRDQLGAEVDVEVRLERVLHLVEQVKSEIEHERKARRGVVGRGSGVPHQYRSGQSQRLVEPLRRRPRRPAADTRRPHRYRLWPPETHRHRAVDQPADGAVMKKPTASRDVRPGESWAFHEHRTLAQVAADDALSAARRIRALLDIANACHVLGDLAVQDTDSAEALSARGDALFDAGIPMVEMGMFLMRTSGQCHGEAYERRKAGAE
mgnify:CR=1 FL=1